MRLPRPLVLAVLATGLGLALPGLAHAATFCVNAPGCVGTSETTLQAALTAAMATTTESDTVRVGDPGPPTTGYGYSDLGNSANEVNIVGSGTSQTVLTSTGTGTVLNVIGKGSAVSHLAIQLPDANDVTGIDTTGSVEDVSITTLDTANKMQEGASFGGDGTEHWFGGSVSLPGTGDNHSGIQTGNDGGVLTIQDVAVSASGPGIALDIRNTVTLRRVSIAAVIGVSGGGITLSLDNVTFHALGAPGIFLATASISGEDAHVDVNHVSAFGNGIAGAAALEADSSTVGLTTTLNARNAIFHGFPVLLQRTASGGGVANVNLAFDETDVGAAVQDNHAPGGGSTTDGGGNVVGDPLWANAVAGNFSLGAGSPAIDKGDTAGLAAGESITDTLGAPRISNGRLDIGAVELQQPPPPPPVVKDTTAPTFNTSKLPKTLRFKRLLAGLTFTVNPNEPTAFDATLAGAASSVKLSKTFNVTVSHKTLGLAAGRRRITLKVRRKLLGKSRKFSLRLTLVATDAAGNKTTKRSTIKVRR